MRLDTPMEPGTPSLRRPNQASVGLDCYPDEAFSEY